MTASSNPRFVCFITMLIDILALVIAGSDAQPNVGNGKVIRRRSNVLAAGHAVDAAQWARDKRRKEQTEAQAPARRQVADRDPPRRPTVRWDPVCHSQRPDYRASTALATTQRLEPLAALLP